MGTPIRVLHVESDTPRQIEVTSRNCVVRWYVEHVDGIVSREIACVTGPGESEALWVPCGGSVWAEVVSLTSGYVYDHWGRPSEGTGVAWVRAVALPGPDGVEFAPRPAYRGFWVEHHHTTTQPLTYEIPIPPGLWRFGRIVFGCTHPAAQFEIYPGWQFMPLFVRAGTWDDPEATETYREVTHQPVFWIPPDVPLIAIETVDMNNGWGANAHAVQFQLAAELLEPAGPVFVPDAVVGS